MGKKIVSTLKMIAMRILNVWCRQQSWRWDRQTSLAALRYKVSIGCQSSLFYLPFEPPIAILLPSASSGLVWLSFPSLPLFGWLLWLQVYYMFAFWPSCQLLPNLPVTWRTL